MKLWKENRLDQEYELSDQEIANGFAAWLRASDELPNLSAPFMLRWYVAHPSGLNSVADVGDLDPLFLRLEDRLRPVWAAYLAERRR